MTDDDLVSHLRRVRRRPMVGLVLTMGLLLLSLGPAGAVELPPLEDDTATTTTAPDGSSTTTTAPAGGSTSTTLLPLGSTTTSSTSSTTTSTTPFFAPTTPGRAPVHRRHD